MVLFYTTDIVLLQYNVIPHLSKCKQCPGVAVLNQKLPDIIEEKMVDNIEYKQRTSTDHSTMETVTQPVEEFIETVFVWAVKKLQHYDFIAHMQANYVNEAKKILAHTVIIFQQNQTFIRFKIFLK